MFKRLIVFVFFSLFLIKFGFGQLVQLGGLGTSSGIICGSNDCPEEDVYIYISGTWNPSTNDLSITWSSCVPMKEVRFESQTTDSNYIIPAENALTNIIITGRRSIELIIHLGSEHVLPEDIYKIYPSPILTESQRLTSSNFLNFEYILD